MSPSVSPSGKRIAVASFQRKGGWDGEIENLKTDIFVMNVEKPPMRKLFASNGGWPTWASEKDLFFHRKEDGKNWGVYKATEGGGRSAAVRVTPEDIDAFTPAAIDEFKVAVATIRKKSSFSDVRTEEQFRHIEIFDAQRGTKQSTKLTQMSRPKADHFNPFVINGGKRIGYHRCRNDLLKVYI